MVKHQMEGIDWWCLPGGGVEPGETAPEAALRELEEECCIRGEVLRQVGHLIDGYGLESVTFLIDIGNQNPCMGTDPEFTHQDQILIDLRWMALSELSERDRAYLWAAGLMSISEFLEEISNWGDELSYPGW